MTTTETEAPLGGMSLFDSKEYATSLTQRERWGEPPMSVLDSCSGAWMARRAEWIAAYPELVETSNALNVFGASLEHRADGDVKRQMEAAGGNTTTFDPYLAELCYDWWTAPGALIYDPFAGGPVAGVVADALGRSYLGVDVRPEQVEANYTGHPDGNACWVAGDSTARPYLAPGTADFVYSCPPYGTLERYSDDPADISTLTWPAFTTTYRQAIRHSIDALRPNRFAAFVVANFKEDERGSSFRVLRDLVGVTISAFTDAGAVYYTDLIHVTPVGTRAITSATHFPRSRRPMPRHQMVVFVKGDARAAVQYVTEGQP